ALQLLPPLVESSHCSVGVGVPVAEASKETASPALAVVLSGSRVTTGGEYTVRIAAALFAVPAVFVNVARSSRPLSDRLADSIVYLEEVAPSIALHVPPPSVESSH